MPKTKLTEDQRRCYRALRKRRTSGEMPPAREMVCWDCGQVVAEEYDHPRGYGDTDHGGYVEPVCRPCHKLRHDMRQANGTGKAFRRRTVAEMSQGLSPDQRRRMDALKRLFDERFDLAGTIVAGMLDCKDADISSGVIAYELGVSRQYVSQLVKTWQDRHGGAGGER